MKRYSLEASYDARMPTPFAVLGIRTSAGFLTRLDYLPLKTPALSAQTEFAQRVWRAIEDYLDTPQNGFDLPMEAQGTPFQRRLWSALCEIPAGEVLSYGAVARLLKSAPRAVGGACGANPIPLVIPCHRVVAANGSLGGFMGGKNETHLAIKRWLLEHEGYAFPSSRANHLSLDRLDPARNENQRFPAR